MFSDDRGHQTFIKIQEYLKAKKYRFNNFEFSIIDTASNLDDLNKKEIYYINKHNTTDKNFGYNIEEGGKNATPSIYTLEKMSKSQQGRITSNETKIKISISRKGQLGVPHTEEFKRKIAENNKKYKTGIKASLKTKEKMSNSRKGIKKTKETVWKNETS